MSLPAIEYADIADAERPLVEETATLFQHFAGGDWNWIRLGGKMFGRPELTYMVYKMRRSGIHVRVHDSGQQFLFGLKISHGDIGEKMYFAYGITEAMAAQAPPEAVGKI
jgi:hypothetical protein